MDLVLCVFFTIFYKFTVFPFEVKYPEHLQQAFVCFIIACCLESIRSSLVQGCKASHGVG